MSPPPLVRHKPADYIKDNALAVIHQQSQGAPSAPSRSIDKADYGKVPEYLKAAKLKLQQDAAIKQEEQRVQAQQVSFFSSKSVTSKRHEQCGHGE